MKLSLEEARRLSSPGVAIARSADNFNWVDVEDDDGGVTLAHTGTARESKPHAALIAHCWNNFDAVVTAFEAYVDHTVADYGELLMGDCGLNEARAALKKAKEVEV